MSQHVRGGGLRAVVAAISFAGRRGTPTVLLALAACAPLGGFTGESPAAEDGNTAAVEPVEGVYEVMSEGEVYSREAYRWTDAGLEACVERPDIGTIAVRLRRIPNGQLEHYRTTLRLWDQFRRLSVDVEGDTIRWGSEDEEFWIERRIDFDASRPLLVFDSGVFSPLSQFVEAYRTDEEDPQEAQALFVGAGSVSTWTVQMEDGRLAVTSPENLTSLLTPRRRGPPSHVGIPEQQVDVRSLDVSSGDVDDRLEVCRREES